MCTRDNGSRQEGTDTILCELEQVEYTGMVELWATDFNVGSFDNCTAQENLLYTFDGINPVLDRIGQEHYFDEGGLATENEYLAGLAQRWLPSLGSSAMVFTCEDVANSPVQVQMSVWDEKLNNTEQHTARVSESDGQRCRWSLYIH